MAFFLSFLAPSMNGQAQLCWSFPNFNLNFGSGRHLAGNDIGHNFACLFHLNFGSGQHFAGLDDADDEELLLMKVLLVIEVVLEVEGF